MKKIAWSVLTVFVVSGLAGCSNSDDKPQGPPPKVEFKPSLETKEGKKDKGKLKTGPVLEP